MRYDIATLQNLANEMVGVSNAACHVRKKVEATSNITYTTDDARHLALDGIQVEAMAVTHWIGMMGRLRETLLRDRPGDWEVIYKQFLGTSESTDDTERQMLVFLKQSLILGVHFKIENLFTNLLKHLGISYKKGFWNISTAILEATGFTVPGPEKDVLTVLANIRNSFHGNGIHNQPDRSYQIDGVDFDFQQDKAVECASWEHIEVIVKANL